MHGALPVSYDESGLHVALMEPLNPQTVEDLRFALGRNVIVVVGDENRIEELINHSYASENEGVADILADLQQTDIGKAGGVEAEVNAGPIVRYVDLVLFQAVKQRASDHSLPSPSTGISRSATGVDGSLVEMAPPPPHLGPIITSRLKVMANLNIAERRIPQDGRIMKIVGGKPIDMRVSTLPTIHGESVVLRVLDRSSVNLDLETLKLPSGDLRLHHRNDRKAKRYLHRHRSHGRW